MEIKKMNLDNLKGILSRQEMKNVMAGSGITAGSGSSPLDIGSGSSSSNVCQSSCDECTVCATKAYPDSYCASYPCLVSGNLWVTKKSCQYY